MAKFLHHFSWVLSRHHFNFLSWWSSIGKIRSFWHILHRLEIGVTRGTANLLACWWKYIPLVKFRASTQGWWNVHRWRQFCWYCSSFGPCWLLHHPSMLQQWLGVDMITESYHLQNDSHLSSLKKLEMFFRSSSSTVTPTLRPRCFLQSRCNFFGLPREKKTPAGSSVWK